MCQYICEWCNSEEIINGLIIILLWTINELVRVVWTNGANHWISVVVLSFVPTSSIGFNSYNIIIVQDDCNEYCHKFNRLFSRRRRVHIHYFTNISRDDIITVIHWLQYLIMNKTKSNKPTGNLPHPPCTWRTSLAKPNTSCRLTAFSAEWYLGEILKYT